MKFCAAFYKGTRPGLAGAYNQVVRAKERGPHSHCELIFSDGMSGSASFMDGGVRLKSIVYDPERWDFIDLPAHLEEPARYFFEAHDKWPYDLMGNLHLAVGFFPNNEWALFCSEALAAALGIPEPWRLGPNALYCILLFLYQPASAGFSIEERA